MTGSIAPQRDLEAMARLSWWSGLPLNSEAGHQLGGGLELTSDQIDPRRADHRHLVRAGAAQRGSQLHARCPFRDHFRLGRTVVALTKDQRLRTYPRPEKLRKWTSLSDHASPTLHLRGCADAMERADPARLFVNATRGATVHQEPADSPAPVHRLSSSEMIAGSTKICDCPGRRR